MKKINLLSLVFVVLCNFYVQKANSQAAILALLFGDQVASEEFNLSLELGWNFSEISNFNELDRKNATNFGLGCNFKLSEQFYLSPSVFFLSDRKFNFSSFAPTTDNDIINGQFENTSGTANLGYIDVPVLFWYQRGKIRFGVGPQVSFLTKSNLVFNGPDGKFTDDIQNDTNSLDYGVMAALSYELGKARKGRGLFIQARYYHGFKDVYKNNISPASNKASYFAVHFSLPFISDALADKNLKAK